MMMELLIDNYNAIIGNHTQSYAQKNGSCIHGAILETD
jgi:hypothetical protein